MKVLLAAINAKYIHSNLAVYDLWAYAWKYQKDIELAEYTINHNTEYILSDIFLRRPDVIAFSCYIWNIEMVKTLIREIAKILPDTRLWLGGPEVSYCAEQLLEQYHCLSGIMVGEGEKTFLQLMEYYVDRSRALCDVQNLVYRELGEIRKNRIGEPLPLSEVPFPYKNISALGLQDLEHRILYYESSRGCPYSCSYCLSSVEKKLRFRDIALVEKELQFFLDHKVAQVKFVDRTFNVWQEHAIAIWQYLVQHDNGVTNFHFEIAADLLTDKEIILLQQMRPGLVQLEIGVQSTNMQTIEEVCRRMDMDRLRDAVRKIRLNKNIHIHLDLIAGLPHEDFESFCCSFCEVYKMKPDKLQLGFLKVLSGTSMAQRAGEYGLVFQDKPPYEVLFTNWLSYEEIIRLKAVEEMVEIYYNSAQYMTSIQMLQQYFPNSFMMYDALAEFCRQKGLSEKKQSRLALYEILYSFAEEKIEQKGYQQFAECLVYDLYLRENWKSRPKFALDEAPYQRQIKEFYRTEAEKRYYLPEYKEFDGKQLARMTHMEHFFSYPPTGELQEIFVLFNYRKRNPLNLNAEVIILRKEELYAFTENHIEKESETNTGFAG